MRNRAITQTTLNYNSMCKFGDSYLGATSSGIFKIWGYDDNGVEIPSLIRSGMFDLGSESKKRFRYFYFGVDIVGSFKLTVFGDGESAGEYMAVGVPGQGVQNIRVPISRMRKARYWSWQIENIDGSFLVLYSVSALPVVAHPGRNSYEGD